MAPLRDRRSNVAEMPLDELEYEEPSRPQSDEDEADETMAVAAELIAKLNGQREKRRKAIEREHDERVKAISRKTITLFEDRRNRVAKYQGDVLKRLQNLNQRREEIEGRILVSMTKIEERTASISKEITAVLEGRIDDIEEIAHEQLPKD